MKHTALFFFIALLNMQLINMNEGSKQKTRPQTNWDSTMKWKIYKIASFKAIFRIPPDSLSYFQERSLNDDSIHHYLSGAKKISNNQTWMGCFLLSYEFADHTIRKAVISQYGSFFYAQSEQCFYHIENNEGKQWLDYLSAAYISMPQKNN